MIARKVRPLLIAACFVAANAAAQTYRVVDLATLSQGYATVVRGPNSAGAGSGGGILDGAQGTRGGRRALLFEIDGARQVAEPAESDSAVVFGLNDAGGYVGSFNTQTGVRAFAGTRAGASRELPPLGGDSASAAYALNNRGQAVGFSSGVGGQRAVMWDANGTPTALPGSPDMSRSRATGINERGDVSGVRSTAAGQRPILWAGGQAPAELTLLAGHTTGEANAINARGDVVGYSADASGSAPRHFMALGRRGRRSRHAAGWRLQPGIRQQWRGRHRRRLDQHCRQPRSAVDARRRAGPEQSYCAVDLRADQGRRHHGRRHDHRHRACASSRASRRGRAGQRSARA